MGINEKKIQISKQKVIDGQIDEIQIKKNHKNIQISRLPEKVLVQAIKDVLRKDKLN